MMLGDVLPAFEAWLAARRLSPATVAAYRAGVIVFGRARPGVDLRALTRRDLDAYLAGLSRSHLAPHTVSLRVRGLKRLFVYLVETQQLLASPLEHWRERRIDALPGPTLTEAEAARLCDAPSPSLPMGVRDRALLELLFATGLRRQEVVGLAVVDVDLAAGLVRVRHGKGGAERLVPLTGAARERLGEYLAHVRPRLVCRRRRGAGVPAVFLGRSGQPLTAGALVQILLRAAAAAGLARVSCHTLRRTMATALLRGGADVRSVAEILGHRRLSTTVRYTRLTIDDVRTAHERTHPRGRDEDDGSPAR